MERRHVVIIGGGFAGLSAARTLENREVNVTLISARNYYLFQPLLYQVATGDLHAEAVRPPFDGFSGAEPSDLFSEPSRGSIPSRR